MKKEKIFTMKKILCVAMSLALVMSVIVFSGNTSTYAAKESFQTPTDENYDDPNLKNFLMLLKMTFTML